MGERRKQASLISINDRQKHFYGKAELTAEISIISKKEYSCLIVHPRAQN